MAYTNNKDSAILMAYTDSKDSANLKVWFLDSGCSNHMCGNIDWFTDLDENFRTTFRLGDDSKVSI